MDFYEVLTAVIQLLIRQVNRQSVHNTAEFMQALKESEHWI